MVRGVSGAVIAGNSATPDHSSSCAPMDAASRRLRRSRARLADKVGEPATHSRKLTAQSTGRLVTCESL
jgi:hypothetical protein